MKKSELVIKLIQKDLKHSQLLESLRKTGLSDEGLYNLDMLSLIAEIVEERDESVLESWDVQYTDFVRQASQLPASPLGEKLYALARECYQEMVLGRNRSRS